MAKYIKTVPIEAEQFDGSEAMIDKYGMIDVGTMNGSQHSDQIIIPTFTGGVHVLDGNWITTEKGGDHSVVDGNDNFEQMFKKLPVIPRAIARAMTAYRHVYGDDKGLSILLADWQRVWALGVLPELTNVPQLILESYRDKAATVARAWLDGYEIDNKS